MNIDFELLIEANYTILTKNERKIASHIINNPNIIYENDIITAAKNMYISKSTLTRFCTKIGLENYKELKYILKQEEVNKKPSKQNFNNIIDEFHNEYTIILDKLKLTVDDKQISKCVNYITKAKHVYIIGVGQSGFLANDLALRLSRLGLKVIAISDIHFIQMTWNTCTIDDLFLFISNSGKTKIINEALKQVSDFGCKTVLLTEFNHINTSKNSTLTILTPQKHKLSLANSISDTFGLNLIVDIIFHHVYISNEKYSKIYEKTIIDHNEI